MNEEEIEEVRGESSIVAVNSEQLEQLLDDSMRSRQSPWRTSPMVYGAMLGLLLLGVLIAIGHHLFYVYLNNREIEEVLVPQNWAIRIGNGFGYLFKTSLVSAVAVAYAQGFWYFVRRRTFEIGSIDTLFGVLYNPFLFFSKDLVQKTPMLFVLAAVSWLLPFSGVFAPGTLTGYHSLRSI